MKKRRGKSRRALGLIFVFVLICCAVLFVKTYGLKSVLNSKQSELASINDSIAAAEEETGRIKTEINYRQTDDYIEDQARESLGLRYPDEIILVPEGDD